jgi:hypothetical protein
MTPEKLSQKARKPLEESAIKALIAAVVEFYETIYPLLTVEGEVQIPPPPKPPKFFQFAKWPAFIAALSAYIAKWEAVGRSLVTFVTKVAKILS